MSGSSGRIVSLNRSNGGVPKLPVHAARVTALGLEGDRQRNRRYHGGPDRALCLYSAERIDALRLEGHPIDPGAVGENVTIAGLRWEGIGPGTTLRLGEVEVEITSYASPCSSIRNAFLDEDSRRIAQLVHPGWSRVYARVLREGMLRVGDAVEALRRLERSV